MTIEIVEKEVSGQVYRNLKFSRNMLPFEYVEVEKTFEEGLETPSIKFGTTSYRYTLRVNKVHTINETSGAITDEVDKGEVGFFATEKLNEMIKDIKADTPFIITKINVASSKGSYSTFMVYGIDKDGNKVEPQWLTEAKALVVETSDGRAAANEMFKKYGINSDVVFSLLSQA